MPENQIAATPLRPAAGDILAGGTTMTSSSASTPFLTVPAGRTWKGSVTVVAAQAITTPAFRDTRVVTAGTGVTPTAGTVIAVAASATADGTAAVTVNDVYVTAPSGNSVTLNIVNSTNFGDQMGAASAAGVLL